MPLALSRCPSSDNAAVNEMGRPRKWRHGNEKPKKQTNKQQTTSKCPAFRRLRTGMERVVADQVMRSRDALMTLSLSSFCSPPSSMASVAMARVPQIPRRFYLGFYRVFFCFFLFCLLVFLVFGPVLRRFFFWPIFFFLHFDDLGSTSPIGFPRFPAGCNLVLPSFT